MKAKKKISKKRTKKASLKLYKTTIQSGSCITIANKHKRSSVIGYKIPPHRRTNSTGPKKSI